MKQFWPFILIGGAVVLAFLLAKKKGGAPATSSTARATTAATTTGKSNLQSVNQAGGAASGQGGWLGFAQNVLNNTTATVTKNKNDTAAIRNLSGTFANLWAGFGGSPSAQTSGSGAGVPINYDNPGANVRPNMPSDGQPNDFSVSTQTGSIAVDTSGFDANTNDEAWSY